jgi:MFS family permease
MAFAMTFGLLLSDYLSRQVINAVFPFLKTDWGLSDSQLGALVSVVALTIGVMSVPISFVADRVGRVKSATVMALVWGAATVACGLAEDFTTMFIARALVGLGEAGYAPARRSDSCLPQRLHAIDGFVSLCGNHRVDAGRRAAAHRASGRPMAFISMGVFG